MNHSFSPRLWDHSRQVLKTAQLDTGGILAAVTYPTYRYVWMRDGVFVAEALRRSGDADHARAFHRFAADAIRRVLRDPHAKLPARYEANGSVDPSDWPNYQLDGYGLWLWALTQDTQGPDGDVLEVGEQVAHYLATHWQDPCFDPWEEGGATRPVATLAALVAGFRAAITLYGSRPWARYYDQSRTVLLGRGVLAQHLRKDLDGPDRVDAATLWAIAPLGVLDPDDPTAEGTVRAVEARLGAPAVHRHLEDTYYGGGVWPILAAFWGWARLVLGNPDAAVSALTWIESTASSTGDLPEQVPVELMAPAYQAHWEAERGPIACPLTWSHAMYMLLVHALRHPA